MPGLQFWRWTALTSYLGLIFLLLNWITWYSPPQALPRSLVILLVVAPLLLPLRGMLHGRRRSHQWSTFLALPYFAMGVDYAFNSEQEWGFGLLITFLSLLYWLGSAMYAKYSGPPRKKKNRKTEAEDVG